MSEALLNDSSGKCILAMYSFIFLQFWHIKLANTDIKYQQSAVFTLKISVSAFKCLRVAGVTERETEGTDDTLQ